MSRFDLTSPVTRRLLGCALLGALGCQSAYAGESKKGYPTDGGAPAASASAKPLESEPVSVDGHKPWAPTLDVVLPETASEAPSKQDWATAAPALDVRITDPGCKAQRIREWYRINCGFGLFEMISGPREGVSFGCTMATKNSESAFCDETSVVFPVRRGDSRAFEALGWGKWGPEPNVSVSEQFLEGDPYPMLSVQGLRWGF